MANKKGHIDINHELAEALMRINLTAYQSRIIWAIFRKTYGWHKSEDRISFTRFEKMTGLRRWHIDRTLRELEILNIITINRNTYINTYKFNANYNTWNIKTITNSGNGLDIKTITNSGNKVLPIEVTETITNSGKHKRNYKRNYSKESNALYGAYKKEEEWNQIKEKREEDCNYKPIPEEFKEMIARVLPTYKDKKKGVSI